jgi:5'-deoxynucleotidase YfbR-like HD superfamily hydrolase
MNKEEVETVAEHSFGTNFLAIILAERMKNKIDLGKVLLMVTLHEIAEAVVGDLVSYSGRDITKEEKYQKERNAVLELKNKFNLDFDFLKIW